MLETRPRNHLKELENCSMPFIRMVFPSEITQIVLRDASHLGLRGRDLMLLAAFSLMEGDCQVDKEEDTSQPMQARKQA